MINKTRQLFYEVGGQYFKDLNEAQKVDLTSIMPAEWVAAAKTVTADWLLTNKDAIIDCLSTTPKSRLRARKSHGAVRKKKTPVAAATSS